MKTEVKVLTSETKSYKIEMDNQTPLEAINQKVLEKLMKETKYEKDKGYAVSIIITLKFN